VLRRENVHGMELGSQILITTVPLDGPITRLVYLLNQSSIHQTSQYVDVLELIYKCYATDINVVFGCIMPISNVFIQHLILTRWVKKTDGI